MNLDQFLTDNTYFIILVLLSVNLFTGFKYISKKSLINKNILTNIFWASYFITQVVLLKLSNLPISLGMNLLLFWVFLLVFSVSLIFSWRRLQGKVTISYQAIKRLFELRRDKALGSSKPEELWKVYGKEREGMYKAMNLWQSVVYGLITAPVLIIIFFGGQFYLFFYYLPYNFQNLFLSDITSYLSPYTALILLIAAYVLDTIFELIVKSLFVDNRS